MSFTVTYFRMLWENVGKTLEAGERRERHDDGQTNEVLSESAFSVGSATEHGGRPTGSAKH